LLVLVEHLTQMVTIHVAQCLQQKVAVVVALIAALELLDQMAAAADITTVVLGQHLIGLFKVEATEETELVELLVVMAAVAVALHLPMESMAALVGLENPLL